MADEITFNKLHEDIQDTLPDCDCIKDLNEETTSIFIRGIRKDKITIDDFRSYWEEGRCRVKENCKTICDNKGVSIYKQIEGHTKGLERLKRISQNKPNRVSYACELKFKNNGGFVKEGKNSPFNHCNFYKSDQFETEKHIETLKIYKL